VGKADDKAFNAMNESSKDLIIEEDKPKKTVVILAESPLNRKGSHVAGSHREDGPVEKGSKKLDRSTTFSDQAYWWKRNHPEFNVIVKPFYKDWEGNTLEDAVSDIKNIEGNVSISFMGHSGSTLGGSPISKFETSRQKNQKAWDLRDLREANLSQDVKESLRRNINRPIRKTVSEHIIDLGDKVDEVIIGACAMGSGCSRSMQSLSSETGKNVYAQLEGSWGTGDIRETGEEPHEKFFVGGKDPTVGGVVFKPNSSPSFIDEERGKRYKSSPTSSIYDYSEQGTLGIEWWDDPEYHEALLGDDVDWGRRIPLSGEYARKRSSELSKYDKRASKFLADEISKTKDIPYKESEEYLSLYNSFLQSYE
jgi:hypothetical protein